MTLPLSASVARNHIPLQAVRSGIEQVIRGKPQAIDLALIALVAGGHLLIEDVPGVGKSTLAQALAQAVGGSFRRIQFTSDLLPSDLTGVNVWRQQGGTFEFIPGPLFANVVLADEVNRAPPRTQSALLEAMGERQISVDGISHGLPSPYMVIATQNPQEHHGTYPLPESQQDRFLVRMSMGYAAAEVEVELLQDPSLSSRSGPSAATTSPEEITDLQARARQVHVDPDLAAYAQRLVHATREHQAIRLGVSTRGALAWMAAARARALLDGRSHVLADDLQELAAPVFSHRIQPARTATETNPELAETLVRELVATIPVPV